MESFLVLVRVNGLLELATRTVFESREAADRYVAVSTPSQEGYGLWPFVMDDSTPVRKWHPDCRWRCHCDDGIGRWHEQVIDTCAMCRTHQPPKDVEPKFIVVSGRFNELRFGEDRGTIAYWRL